MTKAVRCIQTSRVFESVKSAARSLGLTKWRIYAAISRARRTGTVQRTGGWGFEYYDNSEHV